MPRVDEWRQVLLSPQPPAPSLVVLHSLILLAWLQSSHLEGEFIPTYLRRHLAL